MNVLTSPVFATRLVYAAIFILFAILMGEVIHRRGRVVVASAFGADSAVASALSALLRIGWYLLCTGLLLWNFGVGGAYDWQRPKTVEQQITDVSIRLGVSIFVVAFMHGFNVLALSLFHRRKT
jgi:hypothetical protein